LISNYEKQVRHKVIRSSVAPEPQDIERIEREYGPLPYRTTLEQRAYRWRLCVAEALRRMAYDDPVLDRILRRRRPRRRKEG
jgi:hypothetical protein